MDGKYKRDKMRLYFSDGSFAFVLYCLGILLSYLFSVCLRQGDRNRLEVDGVDE